MNAVNEIELNNGKKIQLHPFNKRKDYCQLCEKKQVRLHSHHISYEHDKCATLCEKHHNLVHKRKKHPLHPIDERQQLIIKLTKKNTKNLRTYFGGYAKTGKRKRNASYVINTILEQRLEDGNFEIRSEMGKRISDIIPWEEYKRIGGSFFLNDPDKIIEYLEYITQFNPRTDTATLMNNIEKFVLEKYEKIKEMLKC